MASQTPHASCVDALVHLDDARIENIEAWLAQAAEQGVGDVVWGGVDPRYENRSHKNKTNVTVWHAFGLHPRFVDAAALSRQLQALEVLLQEQRACAVGEIGLDARDDSPASAVQEEAFTAQLKLAQEHRLPLIVHCVRRLRRTIELIEAAGGAPYGGVMHGFAGPRDLVPKLANMGFAFSFGGLLLNERATRCHEAAQAVPRDRLLVESDAPDLAPTQWPRLLQTLAQLRGETPEEIAAVTAANARRTFTMTNVQSKVRDP